MHIHPVLRPAVWTLHRHVLFCRIHTQVFGLGCNAHPPQARLALRRVKKREKLHHMDVGAQCATPWCPNQSMVNSWRKLPSSAERLKMVFFGSVNTLNQ